MVINAKIKCNMIQIVTTLYLGLGIASTAMLSGCERIPPDYRPQTSLAIYGEGDADKGSIIYEEACGQCHQLTPGLNKKGPQLMNIYGAKAAQLADYDYSKGLTSSGWVWDAKTLDTYIADSEKAITDSKMLADPMPNANERSDVIAYLSTLRAPVPALDADGFPIDTDKAAEIFDGNKDATIKPLRDEAIAIPAGANNKPATDFQ